MNNQLDWNLVQVFLAVAATGSLTGAAKRLGLSQPTVGRQLRELEEVLGVPLVVRHSRGVALTHEGEELRETAMGVAVQMQALVRQASGTRTRVEGVVRISASDMVGTHVLMPTLAHIRTAWPGVVVELLLDDGPTDLLKGDADIAVRMFRPAGKELVARRVAQIAVGLFASASYLRQRPPIHTDDDLFEGEHSLIGYDRNLTMVQAFAQSEPRWTREATHFRVDSMLAQLE
ncbi:MAG: LysR family transcriptional regulator, partial [Myxococcota bacterium]